MPKQNPGEPFQRISIEEAKSMIEQSPNEIQVIDVRNEDEYKSGHVSGAILLPVDQILDRIKEIPQNKNLLFICAAGVRSGLACEYVASMGYDQKLLFNIYWYRNFLDFGSKCNGHWWSYELGTKPSLWNSCY